ncbi:acetoacetyl-CoA reductase [Alkalilimnicola ehrlichii MLHE-1]|uniref:3-oxoacyl-[acyl-carrier-protein] reductase n=1 Tax=Alkalilimnicola ehrlichii (strain ATCC BAA-1101 / DSM 17681 / MLHE-1) TaxID=187272 RepID=Q0A5R1_ALKEH|nr:acetoacetyl-CoA reductase [Alkalilimnicola ehrlichii]ABI57826.1 3-oxoacyl-[acyl-carrier-protein] reductase [Alkalilimnicola ehrlichii MLHE-1]
MAERVALVTGGNGGIGTEICRQLGQSGYRVITTCLDAEKENLAGWQAELNAEGVDAAYVECDVADFESCARMARQVEESHGPVDVLVNVAGITKDAFLHKMDADAWAAVLNVNLNSVFNVTRQFVVGMRERGFGRIINIASVNGQTGQFGQTNYSAAKAGMHGFTMALAKEGARKGVTVNTVSPGYIDTAMTAAMPDDVREAIVAQVPAGRMGQPADIARVVRFLAADDAGYITGANIPVNGGLFCSF